MVCFWLFMHQSGWFLDPQLLMYNKLPLCRHAQFTRDINLSASLSVGSHDASTHARQFFPPETHAKNNYKFRGASKWTVSIPCTFPRAGVQPLRNVWKFRSRVPKQDISETRKNVNELKRPPSLLNSSTLPFLFAGSARGADGRGPSRGGCGFAASRNTPPGCLVLGDPARHQVRVEFLPQAHMRKWNRLKCEFVLWRRSINGSGIGVRRKNTRAHFFPRRPSNPLPPAA